MNQNPYQNSTILIVDDDAAGRETLAALLFHESYTLHFASSGAEAIEKAKHTVPDLILLDVMMPDLDGFSVCRELRDTAALAEVPIILVTALDDRDSRLQGLAVGADDFISKPFDRAELRARVRAITRLNRYRSLLVERVKFERVLQLAPNGFIIVKPDYSVYLSNPAFQKLINTSVEESNRITMSDFIVPELRDQFQSEVDRVLASPSYVARFQSVLQCADGVLIPVAVDAGYLEWEGQPSVQVSVRDIRDIQRITGQLEAQVSRLKALRTIDRAIASSFDMNITLGVVIDQAMDNLGITAAALLLRQSQSQMFEYNLLRGVSRSMLRKTTLRLGEGYAGTVAAARRMLSLHEMPAGTVSPLTSNTVASYYGIPLIVKGQVEGIFEVFSDTALKDDDDWFEFFSALATQAAVVIDHASLFESMQRAHNELSIAYDTTLEGWARALELRDKETEGHAQRVTAMTMALSRKLGFSESELVHIRRGALLHDIGKMGIPDSILLKPGPLNDEEWDIMRKHPLYAYNMLSPIPYLRPALDIPLYHHEKWDGSGYPRGLKGEEIPLAARIFAVIDVWDALRFDRPYRKGWAEEQVREYINECSGTHFDPKVVTTFLQLNTTEAPVQRRAVLVVDDEDMILRTASHVLSEQYAVFTTNSPYEALEILDREEIAVILTDQRMPQMTGVQLLERAKHVSPATLGILCSGYVDSDALSDALNLGIVRGFLQKPWNIADLRLRIDEVARQYSAPLNGLQHQVSTVGIQEESYGA